MSDPYDVSPEPVPPRQPLRAAGPQTLSYGTLNYATPSLQPVRPNGGQAVVALVFICILAGLSLVGLGLENIIHQPL